MLGPVPYWDQPFDADITYYSIPVYDEMFTVYLHRSTHFAVSIFSILSSLDWMIWSIMSTGMLLIYILIAVFYQILTFDNELNPFSIIFVTVNRFLGSIDS